MKKHEGEGGLEGIEESVAEGVVSTSAEEVPWVLRKSFAEVSGMVERSMPAEWKVAYPRAYRDAGGWFSPKVPAVDFVGALWKRQRVGRDGLGEIEHDVLRIFGAATKYRMPTFFVAPDLVVGLKKTAPPMAVNWRELRLPYEAGVLMLPCNRGVEADAVYADCAYIAYARCREGEQVVIPFTEDVVVPSEDQFVVAMGSRSRGAPGIGMTLVQHFTESTGGPVIDLQDVKGALEALPVLADWKGKDNGLNTDEQIFAARTLKLLFSVFLVLAERPNYLERGERRLSKRRRAEGPELWTPNVIGRAYRLRREAASEGGTSGVSPRMHWRRGHWRNQVCGVGLVNRRHVWIEPTLVNAPEERCGR